MPDNPEEKKQPEGSDLFDQLASVTPEREISLEEDSGGDGHRTLKERIEESPNLTDMQTADRRMFPDLGSPYLNYVQVSRIFPDVYNPMFRIMVKDIIKNTNSDVSVAEAIAKVNTACSIAIDGEGRIDVLGLAGVAHAEKMASEQNKGLALG